MADPHLEKLAAILVDYSFDMVDFGEAWKKDKKRLWLRFMPAANELAEVITEIILDRGGHVFLEQTPTWWNYTFFSRASKDALKGDYDHRLYKLKNSAARLVILSSANTKSLANVKPERRTLWSKSVRPYSDMAMKVDAEGNFVTPWCGVVFPTQAYAQDMGMALAECRDYLYKAMYLDAEDPVEKWRHVAADQENMIRKVLAPAKTLTITDEADDTKLEMSVEGHRWVISDGHVNFPSDEIFNAPQKDSVNGVITLPTLPQSDHGGPEVRGVWLKFRSGKVVEWDADVGKAYLDDFLKENPGTDHLGEVAFGRHPRIDRISKQILLDEKMGGTVHFALGRAYGSHVLGDGDRSGLNQSVRHWDLIRDMRKPTAYVQVDDSFTLSWDLKVGKWVASPIT
ncbi:MAG: aminopeptidase [Candidatus Bathyarchaeota archaeon]|nr:aminopeptidase [Candidatus Bathyarchaeota archaeon]